MSRSAMNNTWTKDLKESLNGRKATKEKMKPDSNNSSNNSSRENSSSRKRVKPNDKTDTDVKISKPPKKPLELETDMSVLQRRQKQIDYGKNTVGYQNYLEKVPIENRTKEDPRTPDKYTKYSRRSWDMLIKMWRKKLHEYDTGANTNSDAASNADSKDDDDHNGDEDDGDNASQ